MSRPRAERPVAEPRQNLVARLGPFVLEGFFLGAFLVCEHLIDAAGRVPVQLAIAFLVVIATEPLAAYLKLRAVRHRYGDGSLSPLPSSLVFLIPFTCLRVAVFGGVAIEAVATITAEPPSALTINLLIAAVVLKEVVGLRVLRLRRGARVPTKSPFVLELAADLNLAFAAVFSALLMAELFERPMLDTSWNPLFLGVMVILCLLLSFLMITPFRLLTAPAPPDSDSATKRERSGAGLLSSVVVSVFIVAPLFYSSSSEEEHLAQALAARPEPSEFVYSQTSRLKAAALERLLCELPTLRRLELHTRHTGYLPPCVYRIPDLTELDVSGNAFKMLDLRKGEFVKVNASDNQLARISDLKPRETSAVQVLDLSHNVIVEVDAAIARFPELVELDLSHNPLEALPVELTGLRHLRVVRLTETSISPEQLRALQQSMPKTRFER